MSQYKVYNIDAHQSPFNPTFAFVVKLMHGRYVTQDFVSPYKYDSKEHALEAARDAVEVYKKTGVWPAMH